MQTAADKFLVIYVCYICAGYVHTRKRLRLKMQPFLPFGPYVHAQTMKNHKKVTKVKTLQKRFCERKTFDAFSKCVDGALESLLYN